MTDEVKNTNDENPRPEPPQEPAKKHKALKVTITVILMLLILGAAVVGTGILFSLRQTPTPEPTPIVAPLLNACPVIEEQLQMVVTGYGTVEPRVEVQVVPQVSGRVIHVDPNFVNGGFFRAGELLVRIDPADYELAVEQAQSEVARARTQLERELSEADVAQREWDLLHPGEEPTSQLVLRKPQVREAQSALRAAEAQLKRAQLNLDRTEISMPFAGRVISSSVDEGQYVTAAQPVGTVYRADVVEITVPLENEELEWFRLPSTAAGGSSRAARAQVKANFAGREQTWQGVVARSEGRIDPASRLVQVVIEVRDPFAAGENKPPLTPGMFVQADIFGVEVDNILRVPRYAVHGGREVWIARDETLNIRPVKIVRMDDQYAYVTEGLQEGDLVITSPLEVVTDGMTIRVNASDTPCAEMAGEQ